MHVFKLLRITVELSNLSNIVKNGVVKTEDQKYTKIKNMEDKIPGMINLAANTTLTAVEKNTRP